MITETDTSAGRGADDGTRKTGAADGRVVELAGPPSLPPMYLKAAAAGLTGGGGLPDDALAVREVSIDRARLATYARACGFRLGDTLPPTYPHILGFPLQVALMTRPSFPFGLTGLVHLANELTQHRPIGAGERLSVEVRAKDLRDHPKGRQFDMHTAATADDEPVWRSVSTYLKRGGGDEAAPATADPTAGVELRRVGVWRVPADTGRRYAAASGDHNPIHLHPLTARAFGFKRPIAHGMWTKARALAAFEGQLPAALHVQVRFDAPLTLPARVSFHTGGGGPDRAFAVRDARSDKPHLRGRLSPLETAPGGPVWS
jgi:acyl dehydratase